MTLLFCSASDSAEDWRREIARHLPDLEMRVWPETGDIADIEVAVVWKPPAGMLATLPNLKLIVSLGAGVEPILQDPTLPDVPLVRMVADGLTVDMAGYVVFQVLYWHRLMDQYATLQAEARWEQLDHRPASEVTVGFLGMGELGAASAGTLRTLGYRLMGWSRSPKSIEGVKSFSGPDGLAAMLPQCDLLVCLLPLTDETRGILNAKLFAALPKGAVVVNAARGGHLVESDLLDALESGHLRGASLDVFATEPLPADHPLWRHPKVRITPHVAGVTHPSRCVDQVAAAMTALREGRPLPNVVDRSRGY
ncbi:glyoxylate/hydroxypyruvate reductase A [Azospirillum lipoferum]|uniref:Glyoxylate/hydroxypyruvate reductase A n=1 Tax=Azospirillum lipoferum TaxID=193 RepID=A0A5A9GD13_AZOLI|nr:MULTISPECIES: glyoxylate/hydroxypyruvate reductase A [Azospirillum]KAA0592286.1 glyoxylate/hydroxypyruvate reductase A [Azospirillum lipoferum]MCP1612222.1 glyoxylate/hydroxypyruvate reductase A [Azospirillum lipoferum]MDW5536556.1 glyoxylate/hydroxypyruvate reductase A [Azospirillum sp. NL1]